MQKTTKNFFTGMLFGAIAGAAAGILLAPKSGKETRADIARYSSEIKDKIAEELSKIQNFTRESYNSVVDRVVGIYESAKKISEVDADEIRKKLDDQYEKVEDITKKARRKKTDEE